MGPTRPTLWAFRISVSVGLIAILFASRAGNRYLLWGSLATLLLAIFVLQAFGQVILGGDRPEDRLTKEMNGPRGIWIRLGLLILAILLLLLGLGALEPSTLSEWLFASKNAA
jgi:NADH:ubiquinone oxidoreductase subunit 6 (subunit J)